jgi:hypothetical protein
MTEVEWMEAGDLTPLSQVVERLSLRKQRLFCVSLCQLLDFGLFGIDSEQMLGFVQQFADTGRKKTHLRKVRARLRDAQRVLTDSGLPDSRRFNTLELGLLTASEKPAGRAIALFHLALSMFDLARARRQSYAVFRELSGHVDSVIFDPAWRTSTAVALATQMYDSRDFSIMPILADALQDAGCDNDDILAHCRDPQGTHVRGCWVVDLVLGKS